MKRFELLIAMLAALPCTAAAQSRPPLTDGVRRFVTITPRSSRFEMLGEAGFRPEQAIQIMTLNGAQILGQDREYGSVTPGKRADLVVLRGNPVATGTDIYNVVTVFRDGVGFDSARLAEAAKGLVGIR